MTITAFDPVRSFDNAETYQDFFVALDKSMFLTLHKVDWLEKGSLSVTLGPVSGTLMVDLEQGDAPS